MRASPAMQGALGAGRRTGLRGTCCQLTHVCQAAPTARAPRSATRGGSVAASALLTLAVRCGRKGSSPVAGGGSGGGVMAAAARGALLARRLGRRETAGEGQAVAWNSSALKLAVAAGRVQAASGCNARLPRALGCSLRGGRPLGKRGRAASKCGEWLAAPA